MFRFSSQSLLFWLRDNHPSDSHGFSFTALATPALSLRINWTDIFNLLQNVA